MPLVDAKEPERTIGIELVAVAHILHGLVFSADSCHVTLHGALAQASGQSDTLDAYDSCVRGLG